jgi:hypothetical protein
LARKHRPPN